MNELLGFTLICFFMKNQLIGDIINSVLENVVQILRSSGRMTHESHQYAHEIDIVYQLSYERMLTT